MKTFDVIVVGIGPVAQKATQQLANRTSSIAVVKLNPCWDLLYRKFLHQAMGHHPYTDIPLSEKISIFEGPARFVGPTQLEAENEILSAQKILLAPGFEPIMPEPANPMEPALFPWDIANNSSAYKNNTITIAGAGPIGVASACLFNNLGLKTRLITRGSRILAQHEPEIAQFFFNRLCSIGVDILLNKDIKSFPEYLTHPWVTALGLKPMTSSLNLSAAKVFLDPKGVILTTDNLMTSAQKKIWAAGSARAQRYSLCQENEDAQIVANNMFENIFNIQRKTIDPLPIVIPSDPPIATLGLTETEARQKNWDIKTSVTEWPQPAQGIIKLVAKKRTRQLVGAHMVSPHAGELMATLSLVMRAEIPINDLLDDPYYDELSSAPMLVESFRQWMND